MFKPVTRSNIQGYLARTAQSGHYPQSLTTRIEDYGRQFKPTQREQAVLNAMSVKDRADAATQLDISESTVKTHIHSILEKTGHRNIAGILRDLLGIYR